MVCGSVKCLITFVFFSCFLQTTVTAQTAKLVSVSSSENQRQAESTESSISADGRLVAFMSNADNLVVGDQIHSIDVFVRDRQTGGTTRVSADSSGVEGNAASSRGLVSGDGRHVIFTSEATNLVPGDTNNMRDAFLHDRRTGETTRVTFINHQSIVRTIIGFPGCLNFSPHTVWRETTFNLSL